MGKQSAKSRIVQLEEWLKTTKQYKQKQARVASTRKYANKVQ